MTDKVTIFLPWVSFTPDPRQFKPSAPKFGLTPIVDYDSPYEERKPLFVALEIPITEELIYNHAEFEPVVKHNTKAKEWKYECISCGQGANKVSDLATICPVCQQPGYREIQMQECPYPVLTKYGVQYVIQEMENMMLDKGETDEETFPKWSDEDIENEEWVD